MWINSRCSLATHGASERKRLHNSRSLIALLSQLISACENKYPSSVLLIISAIENNVINDLDSNFCDLNIIFTEIVRKKKKERKKEKKIKRQDVPLKCIIYGMITESRKSNENFNYVM
ncbi:hypothetical protein PUN28_010284 [Cardiocondyla obscurior]|uniref:Uncharacterized protein n=1 Tax=Cardiocondyla obscurior TaxID=286306 RepID=A0AAW2FT56_9HYME